MEELEIVEIRPLTRQARTRWAVQRISDKHWLGADNKMHPPTDAGFKARRKFKDEGVAMEAMFDYHLAQATKEVTP